MYYQIPNFPHGPLKAVSAFARKRRVFLPLSHTNAYFREHQGTGVMNTLRGKGGHPRPRSRDGHDPEVRTANLHKSVPVQIIYIGENCLRANPARASVVSAG